MNLVLDTNVLVASVSRKSPTRWLWDSFLREEYIISVSTEILLEYEEIILRMMGPDVSSAILQIIDAAVNVNYITRYFHWELIKADPDDNKFVDCAISANADFIVTHDKHFQELIGGEFPEVRVISISELSEELGKGG